MTPSDSNPAAPAPAERRTCLQLFAAILAVFGLDLLVPRGLHAPAMVYPLLVFVATFRCTRRQAVVVTVLSSLLTAADALLHTDIVTTGWVLSINRTSIVAFEWAALGLGLSLARERASRSHAEVSLAESRARAAESAAELAVAMHGLERESRLREQQGSRLQRSESQLQAILDAAAEGIVTIDSRGTIESFNRAAERLFGWTADEAIGRGVEMLMPSPHKEEHARYMARYLETGVPHIIGVGREVLGVRKDGTTFPVGLSVSEVELDGERKFTGILHDLTERKRLEEQFRQAQKMEAVGRLASGIAHDFNNLLMGIIGCTDLARRTVDEVHPSRSLIDDIRGAAERGASLSRELLNFSRLEPAEALPTKLNAVVEIAERMLRQVIGEDVALEVELARSGGPILGNPTKLEHALLNLAVNARDAMPRGGRLRIATRDVELAAELPTRGRKLAPGRYVALDVEDTGVGMDAKTRERVFEPFFTTKPPGIGTGLGLYTVYGIVEQLGGGIELASEPGRGTRFTLWFPRDERAAAAEPAPAAAPAAPEAPKRGHATILVLEDERLIRITLRHMLGHLGYEVLEADTAARAEQVSRDRANGIDLLLSDIVLPDAIGPDVAAKLVLERPRMRVLYMSAYSADVLVKQGRVPPGTKTLEKPFDELALAEAIRAALDAPVTSA